MNRYHHDGGAQYLRFRCNERLIGAGIQAGVGATRDAYDCALAETIDWLFETEVTNRQSWRDIKIVISLAR